jgi:hypothetical protein
MECTLDMRDVWCAELEDEEYTALGSAAERTRRSRKANSFVQFHISPKLRESFLDLKNAKELWRAVKIVYTVVERSQSHPEYVALICEAKRGRENGGMHFPPRRSGSRTTRRMQREGLDGMLAGILMGGVFPKYAETI